MIQSGRGIGRSRDRKNGKISWKGQCLTSNALVQTEASMVASVVYSDKLQAILVDPASLVEKDPSFLDTVDLVRMPLLPDPPHHPPPFCTKRPEKTNRSATSKRKSGGKATCD